MLGGHGQELPAEFFVYGDGVVVVVIPDFGLTVKVQLTTTTV